MSRTDSTRQPATCSTRAKASCLEDEEDEEGEEGEEPRETGGKITSKHRGVSWDKATGKWKAQITRNCVHQNLGRFAEEEEAAAAYRAAGAAIARGEEPVSGPARPPSSKHIRLNSVFRSISPQD